MRKLTKLSLVAAVAVAGLTTSASAVALEEAIKGVDVSGYVRYRLQTNENGTNAINTSGKTSTGQLIEKEQAHRYTAVMNLATPMGDISKANLGFRVDGVTSNSTSDVNAVTVNLTTANFQVQLGKTTVIAGKQYLNTPLTHNGWDTGTGILAMNSDTPVTLAAGFFANTDDTTINTATATTKEDANLLVLAAIGKIAMVDAQLWYFNIQDVASSFYLEASTEVASVGLKAQYVNTKYDDTTGLANNLDEHTFFGFEASTKIANIDLSAVYTVSGDEGSAVTIEDGQNDAGLISIGEYVSSVGDVAANVKEVSVYGLAAMAPVYAGLSLGLDYAVQEDDSAANLDATEWCLRAAYKVDSRFKVSAYYSSADVDNDNLDDIVNTRVEAKYSF